MRDEVPWVRRPPREYLFEHNALHDPAFHRTAKREHLLTLLEIVEAERTLIFSSDYPHWDIDNPQRTLFAVPVDLRKKICVDIPRALFGDRLK